MADAALAADVLMFINRKHFDINLTMTPEKERLVARFSVTADDGTEFIVHVYRTSAGKPLIYRTAGGKTLQVIDEKEGVFRIQRGPVVRRADQK